MPRIVVLEGPDGSGKTTLAKEFQARHFNYIHCGVPMYGEDLLLYYSGLVMKAYERGQDVVIDRLYLGEGIYGPVMRGQDTLGTRGREAMAKLCCALGVEEVICLPDFPTVLANWTLKKTDKYDPIARTGDYVTGEQKLRAIWSLYQNRLFTPSTGLRNHQQIHFDYRRHNVEELFFARR